MGEGVGTRETPLRVVVEKAIKAGGVDDRHGVLRLRSAGASLRSG